MSESLRDQIAKVLHILFVTPVWPIDRELENPNRPGPLTFGFDDREGLTAAEPELGMGRAGSKPGLAPDHTTESYIGRPQYGFLM